jgi:hypothetical protein
MKNEYAEKRIFTPHSYYETPAHVLGDSQLSHEEKRRVLRTMETDALLLSKATAESMGGGKKPDLRAIELALQDLEKEKGA